MFPHPPEDEKKQKKTMVSRGISSTGKSIARVINSLAGSGNDMLTFRRVGMPKTKVDHRTKGTENSAHHEG